MGHRAMSLAALAVAAAGTAGASNLPPLAENERVRSEFLAAAVANEIREECPTIEGRMLLAVRRAFQLRDYARSLGYSDADIDAMRRSRENRDLLRQQAVEYLEARGAREDDAESLCRLGYDEIRNRTLVGSLLIANE